MSERVIKLGQPRENPGISGFMEDYNSSTRPNPIDERTRVHGDYATSEISPSRDHVRLNDIRSLAPRTGAGTKALKELRSLSDKHKVPIKGTAYAYHKGEGYIHSSKGLRDWYKKHGFEDYGRDEDGGYDIRYYPKEDGREHRASGGALTSDEEQGIFHGPLHSDVAGRTDHLPLHTSNGAYILPADIVSAFGEGNTMAGFKVLKRVFSGIPYSRQKPPYGKGKGAYDGGSAPYGQSGVYGQELQPRASGGKTKGAVPVVLAGGEYSIHPDVVRAIGDGDIHAGHEALDLLVRFVRKDLIKTLQKLPGPKK